MIITKIFEDDDKLQYGIQMEPSDHNYDDDDDVSPWARYNLDICNMNLYKERWKKIFVTCSKNKF